MSLNPNTRTERLETLLNPLEMTGFVALCRALGVSKSTHNRNLINAEVRRHGMAPPPARESGGCPGMRQKHLAANRATGPRGARSHL